MSIGFIIASLKTPKFEYYLPLTILHHVFHIGINLHEPNFYTHFAVYFFSQIAYLGLSIYKYGSEQIEIRVLENILG